MLAINIGITSIGTRLRGHCRNTFKGSVLLWGFRVERLGFRVYGLRLLGFRVYTDSTPGCRGIELSASGLGSVGLDSELM